MDDGTAGDMVVSANYWKEMSKPPDSPSEQNQASKKSTEDGCLTASDVLGGVEWRWKMLDTGNIKVKVAANGAEASRQAATRRTWPSADRGDDANRFESSCRVLEAPLCRSGSSHMRWSGSKRLPLAEMKVVAGHDKREPT